MWFRGGPELDVKIKGMFEPDCEALLCGTYDSWRTESPLSALAGIIVADQFFRNVYRGTPKSFDADNVALSWAKGLVVSSLLESLRNVRLQANHC